MSTTSTGSSEASSSHLEQLDSDAGEHELQQSRDDHDVSDRPDGHKHTLDHMLQHTHTHTHTHTLNICVFKS